MSATTSQRPDSLAACSPKIASNGRNKATKDPSKACGEQPAKVVRAMKASTQAKTKTSLKMTWISVMLKLALCLAFFPGKVALLVREVGQIFIF